MAIDFFFFFEFQIHFIWKNIFQSTKLHNQAHLINISSME